MYSAHNIASWSPNNMAVNKQLICMQHSLHAHYAEFWERSYKPFPHKHRSNSGALRGTAFCAVWMCVSADALRGMPTLLWLWFGRGCLLLDITARSASSNRTSCSGKSVFQWTGRQFCKCSAWCYSWFVFMSRSVAIPPPSPFLVSS